MNVAWVGTYVPSFSRNQQLARYLDAAGVQVRKIRVGLWPDDRFTAFQSGRLRVIIRMLWVYPWLVARLLLARSPDLYLVSYPGWFDVPVVKLVARLRRRPVVFDVFISLYDTTISDRGLASPDSTIARLAGWVDRTSIRSADRVIADTPAHGNFLADMAGIDRERIGVVYVGADDRVFRPLPPVARPGRTVLFYGSYIPLQGVETIVRAAIIVNSMSPTNFQLIGAGQDRPRVEYLAAASGGGGVEFIEPMSLDELPRYMADADLVLGIFGTSEKADRVIPHKVFEAIACGRPLLTGATSAVLETFDSGQVATCPVGDPDLLAEAIEDLLGDQDRSRELAAAGRAAYESRFSLRPQTERLRAELEGVLRP
jgi:glycosyltransferase involved in cell wall biosynthesis